MTAVVERRVPGMSAKSITAVEQLFQLVRDSP